MKRDEPENLDLLAAEYVLGTLAGLARRSFERRVSREPFVAARVRAWEDRFTLLALRLAPVAPSPAVWDSIARRTAGGLRGGRWRALAAAAAMLAYGLADGSNEQGNYADPDYQPVNSPLVVRR